MPQVPQVRRIIFNDEEIGMGFNSASGLAVGSALDGFTVQGNAAADGQEVSASISLVTSHEELMEIMGMSFADQGRYAFFSTSKKASFAESSSFNSTSSFLVARCVVENPLRRGKGFVVSPAAQALLAANRFDEFKTAFGDSFIRGLQTGGEFFAVIRITSRSVNQQAKLASTLHEEANGLLVAGSFTTAFTKANSSESTRSELTATMYQKAGAGAQISPTVEIGEVIARYKSFPEIARSSAAAYETEVATYDTLPLPVPTLEEQEAFLLALQDARERKLRYIQTRNDVEFALRNPTFFEAPPASETLTATSATYTRLINAVTTHASKLSRGLIDPPQMFDPSALTPPLTEPAPITFRRVRNADTTSPEAAKGREIADTNALVALLRATQPEGPIRTGFDIGMGVWQGHTADGPGKQAFAKKLSPAEQLGFADAATFSLQWNNNTAFAAKGAAVAVKDPEVAAKRAAGRGTPPDGLAAALYWLGFDIATGIFGNRALGAQGNTLIGPGSEKIRATLGPDGQAGFNDSLPFNVVRR